MKLKDLHFKFQHSGIAPDIYISNTELQDYITRMEEIRELFKIWNPLLGSISSQIDSAEHMLDARKNR
jgi:hypothetical protein